MLGWWGIWEVLGRWEKEKSRERIPGVGANVV